MKKVLIFALWGFLPFSALAQNVAPVETTAKQAFIMDANTGAVLYAKDADTPMPTSSMSKMMTMYLVFDALKSGKLKMTDELPVSERAWKQEGSRMFLNVGQTANVEDLIRGVAVQSGNDAAVVLAEGLGGGSEYTFAEMMNAKAGELGMTNSRFMNATGLPDPQHYASPRDLAILALALIRDFPEHYHYFSEKEFTYNKIRQGNRNPLLYRNMNVDGLKTGHAEQAGYGLTASAIRSGRRVILVLNGLKNMQQRADESARMLDWAYREYGLYTVAKAGEKLAEVQVWLGREKTVPLVVAQDVALTLPRSARSDLKAVMSFNQPVPAPIAKGQEIGKLTVTVAGAEPREVPLLAGADVPRLGFFARVTAKLQALFSRD